VSGVCVCVVALCCVLKSAILFCCCSKENSLDGERAIAIEAKFAAHKKKSCLTKEEEKVMKFWFAFIHKSVGVAI